MSFIGHYHQLVDDRIGSRIGDRCWNSADPYLKEKIARSLMSHEQFLAGSFYGKFFARNLHLHLLKRKPEEWKSLQVNAVKAVPSAQPVTSSVETKQDPIAAVSGVAQSERETATARGGKKRKREPKQQDEIDEPFSSTFGKKTKRGALIPSLTDENESKARPIARADGERQVDDGLGGVLDVIIAAPKAVSWYMFLLHIFLPLFREV